MENSNIGSVSKNLVIGEFVISCYQKKPYLHIEIPTAAMAFYSPEELVPDFQFEVAEIKEDDSGKFLFGSEEYIIPTFLYQRESGCC